MPQKVEVSKVALTKVVLYKHGMGYFERRGEVGGPSTIALSCNVDEIDDMLKSLLVLNVGGGRTSGVTYESAKPREVRLEEFGFDMQRCRGLIDLIAQIKGIPVTATISGESVSGRVIGLDETEYLVKDVIVRDHFLVLFSNNQVFRRLSLSSISTIKIDDVSFAEEVQEQLEILFQTTKKKDSKSLEIHFEEAGKREVVIAYAIPCPIWKTSYRLVLSSKDSVFIQGMAIVDNVQDVDWTDVQMVLISAAPISFIQPLYDPVQPARRRIAAQGITSAGPVMAERAHKTKSRAMPGAPPAPAAAAFAQSWGAAPAREGMLSLADTVIDELEEAELSVMGEQTGELFEYRLGTPVTVPRNSSALIPIVQQTIDGERLSLYNARLNKQFAYSALKIRNTTNMTLEAGPVMVIEEDAYAGEAMLDVLKPDDSRILPFALDQSCRVVVRTDYRAKPIWKVRAWNGILYLSYHEQFGHVYQIENLAACKKDVLVEHAIRNDAKLTDSPEPAETTETYYRFKVELGSRDSRCLEVWEQTESTRQIHIGDADAIDMPQIEWLMSQNILDDKFTAFLQKAIKKRQEIRELQEEQRKNEAELKQYQVDQERARENIKTLGSSNERYRKAVDDAEDHIMETTATLRQLGEKMSKARREYSELARADLLQEIKSK